MEGRYYFTISKFLLSLEMYNINGYSVVKEKELATHSSILAWRIPGTEEPGGLLSMGRTESDTTEAA